MKRLVWVMVLVASAATAGPATREIEPAAAPAAAARNIPSPLAERQAVVDALRVNDFRALLETMQPLEMAQMEERWKSAQENYPKRIAEDGRDPFVEVDAVWAKLLTPDGVDALVAEWQPKVAAEAKSRVDELNLGLAMMLTSIAKDREMTLEQTMMARDLVLAVQKWANDTDFEDPQRLRRAIDAFATAARASGIETPRELLALPLDDALAHGDAALRATKQALAAYDLDVDGMLASARFTEIERDGDRAKVRSEASVLGVALVHDEELRYYDGQWLDAKHAAMREEWDREREQRNATPPAGAQSPARAAVPSCKADPAMAEKPAAPATAE